MSGISRSSAKSVRKRKWFSEWMGWVVIAPFALIWFGLTFGADAFVGWGAFRQIQSYGYATTEGTILKSKVTESRSDDGTTYSVDIHYQYVVDGKVYRGDRYRYMTISSTGDWATDVVRAYPVDSKRPVYFDAENPADAVLLQGIEGFDLLAFMFLVPFNAVALVCVLAIYYTWFPRPPYEESGGVPVRDDGVEIRAYVPDNSAAFVFGLALSFSCFGMLFVIAFTSGSRPSIPTMLAAWGVNFAIALWFAGPRFVRERTGLCDLVIDRFSERITLPVMHGRKQPLTLGFDAIQEIRIKDECKVDSDGDATHLYHVLLTETGDEAKEHCVWQSREEPKAKQFMTWLRTTLGIFPDLQPQDGGVNRETR